MLTLTLQVALSSLSFLFNSQLLLPKLRTLKEFDYGWKANLDLAVAMAKDIRIDDSLNGEDWKKLKDVPSYLDRIISPSELFYLLEETLNEPTVEAIVQTYPEYAVALAATKELAIIITEDFRHLDITQKNWKNLLAITRMETAPRHSLSFQAALSSINLIYKPPFLGPNFEAITKLDNEIKDNMDLIVAITKDTGIDERFDAADGKELNDVTSHLDENVKYHNTADCTAVCGKQRVDKGKYLELDNTDLNDLRNLFRDLTPSRTDSANLFLKMVHLLEVPLLSNKTSEFLDKALSMENGFLIYQTSIRYEMKDLRRKAEAFILWEFDDISKKDENFLSLKVNELFSLLMSDQLNVRKEISIFEAIERWVMADQTSRQGNVTTLMKAIRLHLCSVSELKMMMDHHLLATLDSVKHSLRTAIDLIQVNSTKLLAMVKNEQRHQVETLFVIGGHGTGLNFITMETFSTLTKHWEYHTGSNTDIEQLQLSFYKTGWTSAVAVGQTIIVFDHDLYSVHSFHAITKEWKVLPSVPNKRLHFAVAVLNDEIYALGGWKDRYTTICERFNTRTGLWTKIPSLRAGKGYASAASLKGKIYIAGGFNYEPLDTFDMFDPEKNRWRALRPLKTARWGLALVTEGNYLWAFGGTYGESERLDSVERYDPEAGIWTNMPAMPTTKHHPEVVYMAGNFYAIGGIEEAVRSRVDVYNPRKQTWNRTSDMNSGRFQFGACVIKNLPNAYDYA